MKKFSAIETSKGTSLHQTALFKPSSVQIGRCGRAVDDIKHFFFLKERNSTKAATSLYCADKTPKAITINVKP
jgi:hypothetical protein